MQGNGGFNTLEYAQELEGAGVPKKQAEIQARAFYKAFDSQMATKHDIALIQRDIGELRKDTKHDIALIHKDIEQIRAESKQNIKNLEEKIESIKGEFDLKIQNATNKQTIILGGLFITVAGAVLGIIFNLARAGLLSITIK